MTNTDDVRYRSKKATSIPSFVMAGLLSAMLISSAFAMVPLNQEAYAAKGEKGSEQGENGDKGKSKNITNNTTSSDTETKSKRHNSTDANPGKGKKGNTNTTEYAKAKKLKSHGLNETVVWPYSEYTAYSLEANGTATGIGNETADESDAEIAVDMSIWKTTKNLVSMDIMNGTITVDGNSMEFYSGQAHYLPNKGKMLLVGFVLVGEEAGGTEVTEVAVENQTTTDLNQTSASNQTSTEIPSTEETMEEDDLEAEGPSLKHIKLWIKVTGEGESLPSEESTEPSTSVEVLRPQSKVASMWFLQMEGEMYYTTS